MQKKINFFFFSNLVQPKTIFKLNNFFLTKKKKTFSFLTSFWKSFSRFSHNLSSKILIWLSTLKKIKNKILLKNFIFYLFSHNNWLSFSDTDILEQSNWNFFQIWKILKKISVNKFETLNFTIFSTNKIFNKIFKNFLSILLVPEKLNTNIFLEKYFYAKHKLGIFI